MTMDGPRKPAGTKRDYAWFLPITLRWMDNDVYGHVNNVIYYSFFDTVVNTFLIGAGVLEPETGPSIGLVAETSCRYLRPLSFPGTVTGALRVGRLGSSSVRYEVGLFAEDGDESAAAEGHFVHVYVDRTSRRPQPMTGDLRAALLPLAGKGMPV